MIILSSGCTISNEYGPYYGRVVEAESKAPIEGAAVLIVFHTVSATVGGAVYNYADAVETVTDKNGEFKLPAHRIFKLGVLKRWDRYGNVTIFKPGYGCYAETKEVGPMFLFDFSLSGRDIETYTLPICRSMEARKSVRLPSISGDVPFEKQAHLIGLINQERSFLGYPGKIDKKAWELLQK
jgi:hypothetical protein